MLQQDVRPALCALGTLPVTRRAPLKLGEWRKAEASGLSNCVEVMFRADGYVAVRHSRNPLVTLTFSWEEWRAFRDGMRAGDFTSPQS